MTREEILEAIKEARDYVGAKEKAYRDGTGAYGSISLRSLLADLGYRPLQQNIIIRACAIGGFNYCVDPTISFRNHEGEWENPPRFACVWGYDQLRSRLDCVRFDWERA